MSKNRFLIINELNTEIINKLESLGFNKLPNCLSKPYANLKKTIVDIEVKTFWCLDKVCFENSIVTIKNQFQENILQLNINDLAVNMEIQEATEILKNHNEWRRFQTLNDMPTESDPKMCKPRDLGIAIDTVVSHFEKK
jgi:hypothetical protein